MSEAKVDFETLRVVGKGTCVGGDHPDPPLDDYPLLAWCEQHLQFGKRMVFLCDNTASVHDVAIALAATPDVERLAARFKTTPEHVTQAVAYAVRAGFLGK